MAADHATRHWNERAAGPPHAPATRRFVRATLAVAGGVAVVVGVAVTTSPRSFIDVAGRPTADLLNETRAPGGALLAAGVLIVVAAVRRRHLRAAALIATFIYLGYGVARTASLVVDGRPSATLIGATMVELAIGLASLAAVIASDEDTPTDRDR